MITRVIYTILGIIIASYVIYIRFIITRVPKELYLFNPTQYNMLILLFIWIPISLYMLYKNILILNNSTKENKLIQRIMIKISEIFNNALKELYRFIAGFFTNNYEIVSSFGKYFYKIFGSRNENILIIISLVIRFIIVIAFIIDILIFFKLNYFYKSLFLLSIPLIINIILFILRDLAENVEEAKSYLVIKEHRDAIMIFQPSPGNEDINLEYHIDQYYICSKIQGYLEVYDFLYKYYSPRFSLIIYSLYLFGWLYVLYFNIF